jgi:hypothetical protein
MNITLTVVAIVLVLAVLAVAAWTLLIAPFVVPWRHVKQHPRLH